VKRQPRSRQALAVAALAALVVSGCSGATGESTRADEASTGPISVEVSAGIGAGVVEALAANKQSHDSDADHQWDIASEHPVSLDGDSATSDAAGVRIDGTTIRITEAGTYRLSGRLDDGQVVVDAAGDGTVRLVLDGADITSSTTSAIAVMKAGKAMVVLADQSTNRLTDAGEYVHPDATTDEPNAALFSKADLTVAGSGALTVTGRANDGIGGKDGVVLAGGRITVDAVDDGIRGKDYLIVRDATVDVTAGGDGLKADNAEDTSAGYVHLASGATTVLAERDGVDAATDVLIADGSATITAGGGNGATVAADVSAKGIKGGVSVVVGGGDLTVDAADDAVHSNGVVIVDAGTLRLRSGDDGVHADTDLTIRGGTLTVEQSYEGLESAVVAISGGEIDVTAADDGINIAGGNDGSGTQPGRGGPMDQFAANDDQQLRITGGTVVINAQGDGLDSNGHVTMTGGTVVVNGPTNGGNGAIDVNGTFDISGGMLLAAGSAGMAEAPEASSSQGWIAATLEATRPAGTVVQIVDGSGDRIATFKSAKSFQSVVFSSSAVTSGAEYAIHIGGSATGAQIGGLYDGGSTSGATHVTDVTAGAGGSGMQGPGGMPGGGMPGGGMPGGGVPGGGMPGGVPGR